MLDIPYASELLNIKNKGQIEQEVEKAIADAFIPLDKANRKILDHFIDEVIDKGKDIAPSAPRFVIELTAEDEKLTNLLKESVIKKDQDKKSKSIFDWMNDYFN